MRASQLQKLLRRQAASAVVIRRHTGDVRPEAAVDAHKGQSFVHHQGIIGQPDDAVRLVLPDHVDAVLLDLRIGGGDIQQHPVVPPGQGLADVMGQSGKKGVVYPRQDYRHRIGFVCFQPTCILVDLISQLSGGFLHLYSVAFPHGDAVEYLGHGPQGHTGLLRHILHRRHSVFHIRLLVKCFICKAQMDCPAPCLSVS